MPRSPVGEIVYPVCQVDECGIGGGDNDGDALVCQAVSKIKRSEIARRTTMRRAVEGTDRMRREATALDLGGYN